MKKSKSNSKRQKLRTKRSLNGVEGLEERRVLAANVLATGVSSVAANVTQDVTLTVATPDAPAGSEAVLAIDVSASSGSNIDPGAITILDSTGASVATSFSNSNAVGTSSQATASLPAGVYTLQLSGENGTSGSYTVGVSLLGDVTEGDGTVGAVSSSELTAAQLAFSQTLGTGNFVTDLFNRVHGFSGNNGGLDAGFDSNGDGAIDAADLAAIRQNAELGTVIVDIEADNDAPVIDNIRLTNDTGTSATDQITSVASVLADISDNSQITSVTASVNGGTAIEISPLVGDFNATGSFLLDASDLATINGGLAPADGVVTVQFIGTDAVGNVGTPVSFSFTLITNNTAPTTTGIGNLTATEDAAFQASVAGSFADANVGDVLTYTAAGLPAWLSLGASTGALSGTPENADVGTSSITITATDSQGAAVSSTFNLTVVNTNDAPVLSTAIGMQAADEDDPFTLNLNNFFSDPDGDALSFTAVQATGFDANGNVLNSSALPGWLTLSNGILSGTPSDGDAGSFQVAVVAADASGATANALVDFNVTDLNDAPTLVSAIPDQSATEDLAFSLNISSFFADVDPGDTLTFTAAGLPSSLSVNGGVISGTPDDAAVGANSVTITATDVFGATVSDTFVLTVANVNDVPVANNDAFLVNPAAANGTIVGTVVATDDDVMDNLTFAIISGDPNGIFAINPATGVITVANTSLLVDGTVQSLVVQVTDNAAASDTAAITVMIASNLPPTAANDNGGSVLDTDTLSIAGSALVANDTDPDGDALNVSAVNATSNLGATVTLVGGNVVFDPSTSNTLLSLGDGESLTDTFTYTTSDSNGGTDTATVDVVVNGVDLVNYRLEILDANGNVTTSVAAGSDFTLVGFVEDLRANPDGVFAGYLDVNYAGVPVTVNGAIDHTTGPYVSGLSGTNTVPGLLDEVGGFAGLSPLGAGEMELFRQAFTAGSSAGTLAFTSDEPEQQAANATLVFGQNTAVPVPQIEFGSVTLTITGSSAAAGVIFNPHDVNQDGFVSPMDALVVINELNGSGVGVVGADVNGDGNVTPVDALLVINDLFLGSAGGSNVLVGDESDVSEAALADALEFVFEELATDIQADPLATAAMLTDLDSPLVDSIYEVINAEEAEQEALWEALADDLASLLSNV